MGHASRVQGSSSPCGTGSALRPFLPLVDSLAVLIFTILCLGRLSPSSVCLYRVSVILLLYWLVHPVLRAHNLVPSLLPREAGTLS